ncbi:T9SS type A sorting domain-containing protein [uncultured Aquimarina sp.]|uniref:T9SS type A sorting domain-containing protein n=1 Tax=uncultured Aquimarina sp. TaxID=575652 RepID=UPI002616CD00|nr:T9SS type A sorting domain-containing protein [uncultured Aquimarina sp.]
MKKIILCAVALLCCIIASGQVTNEGKPKSWNTEFLSIEKQSLVAIEMPDFDLIKIQKEDVINDQDRSKVYRFGYEFDVNYNINNSGKWSQLSNGDWIWRIRFKSKKARTMNFVFKKFRLPEGASLYLYNIDKSDLLGAYTSTFNRDDEMLGTWLVEGEDIVLEYFVPKSAKGKEKLQISKIVHGYRSVTDFDVQQKALNDSGDCNQDVDCPVGSDFDDIKDELKRGVGLMVVGSSGFCTGTLINNTNNDGAPYFLSANHCFENNNTGAVGNTSIWAFRFNWISPNPSCATTTNSTNGTFDQTTSGSTILARNTKSDVLLLNIDSSLPDSWDLYWAGWDRTGTAPSFAIGIHHPSGDIMKVCRENQSPTERIIDFNGNPTTEMWNVADWDLGVTERGSSGSALFDPSGRIIGQLAGGAAACVFTNDNDQFDVYGRFDVSWDFGTTNATRLSNWLDPANTGATTLNSLAEEITLSVNENKLDNSTALYPNPSNGVFNVSNNSGSRLTYNLFSITGQLVGKGEMIDKNTVLDMSANVSGIYFISITDAATNVNITKKLVINK